MNNCYTCGATLKKEKRDIARYWGRELIVLNDVPALVCKQCGERYFEAKVSQKIDQKIQQALQKKVSTQQRINVPVLQF